MSDTSEKPEWINADNLRKYQTAESVLLPMSRETFEKLYLNPKSPRTTSKLRKRFGNPTPISLLGFLVASMPNAMITMGWRGAGGHAGAVIPVFIWFGGLVQVLGAVGEWIIGNTFACALFFTYGTFWFVTGTNLMPFFATGNQYSPTGDWWEGQQSPSYAASQAYFFVTLGIVTLLYLVCSVRTNACLFSALFLLVITFGLFAGAYFQLALGNHEVAAKLEIAAGAFNFALCFPVWILFFAQLLDAVDFPINVPVGDFSSIIPGKSQRLREDEEA